MRRFLLSFVLGIFHLASVCNPAKIPSFFALPRPRSKEKLASLTERLLAAKAESGKTFDEIANELGLTNAYTCQIFLGQAQITPEMAVKLKAALPKIKDEDIRIIMSPPMRTFDSDIIKEPNVYRTYEAIMHYGEAIKMLINEQCGDGIMSAIDFYLTVGTTTGALGERRVVLTFNGKFLPHIQQDSDRATIE